MISIMRKLGLRGYVVGTRPGVLIRGHLHLLREEYAIYTRLPCGVQPINQEFIG